MTEFLLRFSSKNRQKSGTSKRMISVEYLLKRILNRYFPDIEHNLEISKSKKTLRYYDYYWKQIVDRIDGRIKQISR